MTTPDQVNGDRGDEQDGKKHPPAEGSLPCEGVQRGGKWSDRFPGVGDRGAASSTVLHPQVPKHAAAKREAARQRDAERLGEV